MKLSPALVPWSISCCDEVAEFEYDINNCYVYITVVCNCSKNECQQRIEEYIKEHGSIPENIENQIGVDLIKLKFNEIIFLSVYDQRKDYKTEERYDMSLISKDLFEGNKYHDLWNKTGNCPLSGLYEVTDSIHGDILKYNKDIYTHWLITISDPPQEISIISKNFEWEIKNNEIC